MIVVDRERSASGRPIVGFNIDDDLPAIVAPKSVNEPSLIRGQGTWLATSNLFVGCHGDGALVCVVALAGKRAAANQLGNAIVNEGPFFRDPCRLFRSADIDDGVILCTRPAGAAVWRLKGRESRLLAPSQGLLTYSAGHSSADPVPGGGWLIDRLERLHAMTRIAEADVAERLNDVRLGESTACSLLIDPHNGVGRILRRHNMSVHDSIRRSA